MTQGNATPPVVRDHFWVEREYNREKYPIVLRAAKDTLSAGETSLARAVGRVILAERGPISLRDRGEAVIDGVRASQPFAFASAGIQGTVTQMILEACGADTTALVELGAGWGRNLFLAWLSGLVPPRARLYALEYAATARMAAELLSKLEAGLDFTPLAYDYHAPDYGDLPRGSEHTVLVTVHSIEQIPELKREVFTALLDQLPNVTGVHLEPVGWQLPPGPLAGRAPCSSPAYAEAHDYNRNFWSLLTALEAEGLIEIDDVQADIIGLNPKNPSTLIRWHARRR